MKVAGDRSWKSIEAAIALAEADGYVMGHTCCTIQNAGGQAYWYGPGNSCGQGGDELWSLKAGMAHGRMTIV